MNYRFFYKKTIVMLEPEIFLTFSEVDLPKMGLPFVTNIAHLNLKSIFNILNAIMAKYRFLAIKTA